MSFRPVLAALLLSAMCAPMAQGDTADEAADFILARTGITKGLCLDVGCGDGSLALRLAAKTKLRIHLLEFDKAAAAKTREKAFATGLYGDRLSVSRADPVRLPYPDSCANLVICGDFLSGGWRGRRIRELCRLVSPNGAVLVGQAAPAGNIDGEAIRRQLEDREVFDPEIIERNGIWVLVTRRPAKGIDEWSHRAHDPANTYGSNDLRAVPPFRLKWSNAPTAALASSGIYIAGGKEFILGYAYPEYPDTTPCIHAYDAYNGYELWSRVGKEALPIDRALKHYNPEKASSDAVATKNALYVLGGERCHVFDPDTGEIVREFSIPPEPTISPGDVWLHMALSDGVLIGAAGRSPDSRPSNHGMGMRGACRKIFALDPESGDVLWSRNMLVWTTGFAAGGGRLYALDSSYALRCIDLGTGEDIWHGEPLSIPEGSAPSIVTLYRNKVWVLYWKRLGEKKHAPRVTVASAGDGRRLFDPDFGGKQHRFLTFAGDTVISQLPHSGEACAAVDVETGLVKWVKRLGLGGCTPILLSSSGHIFGRFRGGPGYMSTKGGKPITFMGTRPTCFFPPVPANGMLYVLAPGCHCSHPFRSHYAMAPGEPPPAEANPEDRLTTGPAYGAETASGGTPYWIGWRNGETRPGVTAENAPPQMMKAWSLTLPGEAAPVSAGDGLVFCALSDHTLRALDAADGRERWRYIAEGAVTASPWLHEGRVYIGDDGGMIHCVRAGDGALVWRYRAALTDDRIVLGGRFASRWPARCGVLVRDGVAYFAAGLFPPDRVGIGGLDALTGKPAWEYVSPWGRMTASGHLAVSGDQLLIPSAWGPAKGQLLMAAGKAIIVRTSGLEYIHHVAGYHRRSSALPVVTDDMIYLADGHAMTARKRDAYIFSGGGLKLSNPPKQKRNEKAKPLPPEIETWRAWKDRNMTAAILAGDVLLSGGKERVYATGREDGKELWSADAPGRVTDLAFQNGRLFVVCSGGHVLCFEARKGDDDAQ